MTPEIVFIAVWTLISYAAIGLFAYRSGRSDENARWLACRGPEAAPPISSVRPDSIFPVLTAEERRQAWDAPVRCAMAVRGRTGCSMHNALEVVRAIHSEELPPDTQRSRR